MRSAAITPRRPPRQPIEPSQLRQLFHQLFYQRSSQLRLRYSELWFQLEGVTAVGRVPPLAYAFPAGFEVVLLT